MLKVNIENIKLKIDDNPQVLLKQINFELSAGKIYTILGKNGTGKSTLIKSLTNLLNKNSYSISGEILFHNKNILKMNYDELLQLRRHKIRYVFQDAVNCFDPLKTFKYYFNNSAFDKNKLIELLEYFLLPPFDKIKRLHPYEVSGGMAQRLNIVLAIIAQPELLILDEPTSGIDYTASNLLMLKIKDFVVSDMRSVLLVTQDINFAEKISDKIAFLHNRTITPFDDTITFLMNTSDDELSEFKKSYEALI